MSLGKVGGRIPTDSVLLEDLFSFQCQISSLQRHSLEQHVAQGRREQKTLDDDVRSQGVLWSETRILSRVSGGFEPTSRLFNQIRSRYSHRTSACCNKCGESHARRAWVGFMY